MHFSSKEICTIIKACTKAKLQELKVGDLQLTFRSKTESTPRPDPDEKRVYKNEEVDVSTSLLKHELELRDKQIEDLALEDPMKLEEMLANNELETEDEYAEFDSISTGSNIPRK